MRRRDCLALPLILAGCGSGTEGEMEFQIQPSPILRKSKNVFPAGVEGEWTPALTFAVPGDTSFTYDDQFGRYIKIGSYVFCYGFLQSTTYSYSTASGALRLTGLPFKVLSGTEFGWIGACQMAGMTNAAKTRIVFQPAAGQTYGVFLAAGIAAISVIDPTDFPTGGIAKQVYISCWYQIEGFA